MITFLRQAPTLVWLILSGATFLSWWFGTGHAAHAQDQIVPTMMGLIVLAFVKVRLVIMYFMEIRHAPLPLRLICEAWVLLVCAALLILYWSGVK